MVLKEGEKVHVIIRRNFDGDIRRHFAGEVEAVSGNVARVKGYVFVFNTITNEFVRKPERRPRMLGLADSGNIINIIPPDVILEDLEYRYYRGKQLVITDGQDFMLDINEFGGAR